MMIVLLSCSTTAQERRPNTAATQQPHQAQSSQQQPPPPPPEHRYNDNQQLFLGNVPHNATEEELTRLFAKFGTVIDMRLNNNKNSPKTVAGRAPPLYGFITYDDPEAVQNCLAHMVMVCCCCCNISTFGAGLPLNSYSHREMQI